MVVSSISTFATREDLRTTLARVHQQLSLASAEVSTGRHADVGVTLGRATAHLVDDRRVFTEIETIQATNAQLAGRLAQTDSALAAMTDLAEGFFQTLVASRQSSTGGALLIADARASAWLR